MTLDKGVPEGGLWGCSLCQLLVLDKAVLLQHIREEHCQKPASKYPQVSSLPNQQTEGAKAAQNKDKSCDMDIQAQREGKSKKDNQDQNENQTRPKDNQGPAVQNMLQSQRTTGMKDWIFKWTCFYCKWEASSKDIVLQHIKVNL